MNDGKPDNNENQTSDPGNLEIDGLSLDDISTDPMYVNIGPTHPATHGTFRVYAKLDGETIIQSGHSLYRPSQLLQQPHQ